jgi:hypothetical protein
MNTPTKTFTFNPNKDKIEMIIKTANSYAVLAKLLRSEYYLQLTKKTLSLLEDYIIIDINEAA